LFRTRTRTPTVSKTEEHATEAQRLEEQLNIEHAGSRTEEHGTPTGSITENHPAERQRDEMRLSTKNSRTFSISNSTAETITTLIITVCIIITITTVIIIQRNHFSETDNNAS
jgi:hypothetical protein